VPTSPLPRLAAVACAGVLAVGLAACGSSTGSASSSSAAAGSTAAAGSSAAATTASSSTSSSGTAAGAATGATVTAEEADFTITLSSSTLPAGTYTFTVRNTGKATHSLTIQGPGGVNVTSDKVQGGQSTTMTVTLQPGTYDVYCPIGNHKAMGMDSTLTVS
jgi:plastocyanin